MPNRFTNEALKPFLTSFFQMSRAVWAHHLALRQSVGIDMTEVAALRRSYPPGFLDALRLSMKCFLQDLNDAVPDLNDGGGISMAKEIPEINLNVFASNVEVWIEIAQRGHEQAVRHSLFGGGGSQSMGSEGDRERSSPKEIGSDIKSFNLFLHWTAAHHTALLLCAEGARLREEFHKLFRIQPEESKSELATDSVEETETKSTANAEEIPKITIHIQVDNVEEADAKKEDKGWSRCLSWLSWSTLTANLTLYTAIQSGVRLTILCMALLCPLLILSSDIVYHAHHGMSFYYGIFWTGITLIVLHSSLLGTASSTGVQRAVGTIVGGSLALGVGWSNDPAVIIIVGLVVFGIGGYFGVVLVKSDYGSRLLLVTFFLIIGDYYKGSGPLFTTYVSRMCAVLAGVLLTYLGSILLFPRSATSRVLGELNKMHCAARDLLCNAWMASGLVPSPEEGGEDSSVIEDALSSHLAFNSSYKAFKAYKIIADDESYVGTLWGKRILVPSWLVLRSLPTYLPEEELLEVSKAIGTLRQGIIAFSLSFTEAFDKETAEIILGRYPKGLIEAIKVLTESFIEDVIRSLPDEHGHFHGEKQEVPPFNLTRLTQCVRVLEHISESQYMKIHSRDMGDPQPHDEDPLLIRLGLTVDDPSSNPWLSEDSFPSWKDSQGVSLIPKLDLTMILLPQTKVGFLNLMRWVMARLALSDFCEAAEKLRKAVNELLAKL